MAARLYLTNAAASYTPGTFRGAWDAHANITKKLGTSAEGSSTSNAAAEFTATNNWDVRLGTWVSEPVANSGSLSGSLSAAVYASVTRADSHFVTHLHAYVTVGDSDTVRGTLATDTIGATEWSTAAVAHSATLSAVTVSAGDRIVVEIGFQAQNTVTTAFVGQLFYGGTGTDIVAGGTDETRPGWIEFSDPANVLAAGGPATVAAAAALAGAGALTSGASATTTSAVSGAGSGTVSASAEVQKVAAASLSGSGALVATGATSALPAVTLSGAGAFATAPTQTWASTASFAGAGSFTPTPVSFRPVAALTDNFDDNVRDTALWPSTYGTTSETGGVASVAALSTGALSGYGSAAAYRFADTSVFVKATPPSVGTATFAYAALTLYADAPTYQKLMRIRVDSVLSIVGWSYVEGSPAVTQWSNSTAYNATNHAWLRIRESGGITFFDASPDGSSWSNLGSQSTPTSFVNNSIVEIDLEARRSGGTGTDATFDNLNLSQGVQAAVSLSGTGSLTTATTQTWASTATWAGAGGLTASPFVQRSLTVSLDGLGALSATPTRGQAASATLSGSGALSSSLVPTQFGAVALAGAGALSATPIAVSTPTSTLSGAGSLTAEASVGRAAGGALAGAGALTASATVTVRPAVALAGAGELAALTVSPVSLNGASVFTASPSVGHALQISFTGAGVFGSASPLTRSYVSSSAIIPNPERGFFAYTETHYTSGGLGYTALSAAALDNARTTSGQSLVFRHVVMEKFRTQDALDSFWISLLNNDFAAVRSTGFKAILRFSYSNSGDTTAPYDADPQVARILAHIEQLAPTINANADVIDCIEMGFIGMNGEGYYTENFGDQGSVSTLQYNDRLTVLAAGLDHFDSRIFLNVRHPGLKARWFGG